jgi:hypothetical protein
MEDEPRIECPAQIGGEGQLWRRGLREIDRTQNGSNRNHGSPTIPRVNQREGKNRHDVAARSPRAAALLIIVRLSTEDSKAELRRE